MKYDFVLWNTIDLKKQEYPLGQSFYGSRFVFRAYRNGLLPMFWKTQNP